MAGRGSQLSAEAFTDVLAAAQVGAGWALESLYRSMAPAVVGYLRLQGVEDPEDLSSEVFLGAFRNLGGFTGDAGGFRSWVFAIAHRRVLDDRRRRSRRPAPEGFEAVADRPGGADAEGEVMDRLGTEAVLDLCGRLSPDQRDVVLLRLVADLGLEETAEALGKSTGAVKALQHRAMAFLRKELQNENFEEGVSR